jgi:hypothetical protein
LLAAEGLNVMMIALVEEGLFNGYGVGTQNTVTIFHLQFVDDILLVG